MGKPRQTHCLRGHRFTVTNTIINDRNGKPTRSCKTCHNLRSRLKYRNDEANREYHKAKAIKRYAKLKELRDAGQL